MTVSLSSPIEPTSASVKKQSAKTYTKPTPNNASTYTPTHPGLLRVVLEEGTSSDGEDSYSSYLVAERDFEPNTVIAHLTGLTPGPKAYSSVQFGPGENDHFELNSDLLFVNHSCKPNVAFDLSSSLPSSSESESTIFSPKWNLKTLSRGLKKGETLTFFYPSTEWDMGVPFDCLCKETSCLGSIQGAKHLELKTLEDQEFINPWILQKKRSGDA